MSKSVGILSILVANKHQPIIKGKTPEKAQKVLQERFQYINPMSISCLIYKATTKKLLDFKDVHKYTNSYQGTFDKVVDLLTEKFHYTWKNTEIYFQATMLINIGSKYLVLMSAIQKDQKDETTNFTEAVLQIIRHFKFIKDTKKGKSVLQTLTSKLTSVAPKRSCENLEHIKKDLTTHFTN